MAPKKVDSKKKSAAAKAPAAAKKGEKGDKGAKKGAKKAPKSLLFEKRPKNFSVGADLRIKADVSRYVKWPAYIKRQRSKRVLMNRMKTPPAVHQFQCPVDMHLKKELFKFAMKYRPEDKFQRKERLKKMAEAKVKNPKAAHQPKKAEVKCGIQRITRLVEQQRAKLVLIANDVDPIELVIYLPALCKKQGVPYCIIKSKAALGRIVGLKTATCLAFTTVNEADQAAFTKLTESVNTSFNERFAEIQKTWGGLKLSKTAKAKAKAKKRMMKQ